MYKYSRNRKRMNLLINKDNNYNYIIINNLFGLQNVLWF